MGMTALTDGTEDSFKRLMSSVANKQAQMNQLQQLTTRNHTGLNKLTPLPSLPPEKVVAYKRKKKNGKFRQNNTIVVDVAKIPDGLDMEGWLWYYKTHGIALLDSRK
jgi:ABC-type transporter Mla subunit MlaD